MTSEEPYGIAQFLYIRTAKPQSVLTDLLEIDVQHFASVFEREPAVFPYDFFPVPEKPSRGIHG
jgi:hypothetical protein